jgi:hypothetical protein
MSAENGTVTVPLSYLAGADAQDTALTLLSAGFWPCILYPVGAVVRDGEPEDGKRPMGTGWGLKRITLGQIDAHFDNFPDAGVGICLGAERGPQGHWLIDIEADGPEAEESRLALFGGPPPATCGWSSKRGPHALIIVEDQERFRAIVAALVDGRGVIKHEVLPGLELRVGGNNKNGQPRQFQSACPPTIGTDGAARVWNGIEAIAVLPECAYVLLEELAAQKAAQQAPAVTLGANAHDPAWDGTLDIALAEEIENKRVWFTKKRNALAENVRDAAEGSRHETLLAMARTLGGYLAHPIIAQFGLLAEEDVVTALGGAALEAGLEQTEVDQTIADGIAYGKAEPLPWPEALDLPDVCQGDDPEEPQDDLEDDWGGEPQSALGDDWDDWDDEGYDDPAFDADDDWNGGGDDGLDPAEDADVDDAPGPTHAHAPASGGNGQAKPKGGTGKVEDPEEGEVLDRFPVLDPTALHGPAGDFVMAVNAETEADPVGMLVQLLVGFASAIGRKPYFAVGGTRHYLNLFACLVGMTSIGRKGTSLDMALWLLKKTDPTWGKNCIWSGLVSGEGLIYHVRDEVKKGDKVIDGGVHDKRLLVIESEFARTLRAMGREESTLSSVMRLAWDSGDLGTLAKNSPNKATGAHVSLVCHITQDDLRSFLSKTDIGNGFGNRFAWLLVRRSKLLPDGGSLEGLPLGGIVHAFEGAWLFGRNHVMAMERDADAAALWVQVYPVLTQGSPGLLGLMLSRAEAQVMRLACVYALLDRKPVVRVEHLRAALALWKYCEDSARLIFGDRFADPDAEKLLAALRAAPAGLTRTQICVDVFARNKSAKVIIGLLSRLLTRGMVHSVPEQTEAGRTVKRWRPGKGAPSPLS